MNVAGSSSVGRSLKASFPALPKKLHSDRDAFVYLPVSDLDSHSFDAALDLRRKFLNHGQELIALAQRGGGIQAAPTGSEEAEIVAPFERLLSTAVGCMKHLHSGTAPRSDMPEFQELLRELKVIDRR